MRIHLLSDLHLEVASMKYQNPKCDVIVLAGDIGTGLLAFDWIDNFLPDKTPIIYLAGNHEFYHRNLHDHRELMRMKARRSTKHLFYLDDDECVIDGEHFLGGTLWTDLEFCGNAVQGALDITMGMNDLRLIGGMTPHAWVDMYRTTFDFLKSKITEDSIVVTHHLPHEMSVDEQYKGSRLNVGFASNTLRKLPVMPKLWMHGHTHHSCDYKLYDTTRVVCNPRGYVGYETQPNFDPAFVINIGEELGVEVH